MEGRAFYENLLGQPLQSVLPDGFNKKILVVQTKCMCILLVQLK